MTFILKGVFLNLKKLSIKIHPYEALELKTLTKFLEHQNIPVLRVDTFAVDFSYLNLEGLQTQIPE